MKELTSSEIDAVGGAGKLREYYEDIVWIHADLVNRLSDWMVRVF